MYEKFLSLNRIGKFLAVFLTLSLAASILLPIPYVIELAGEPVNVLGKYNEKNMISIDKSIKTYSTKGKLFMTTVSVGGGPGYWMPLIAGIKGFFDPEITVLPTEAVYGVNKPEDEIKKENKQQMSGAQNNAIVQSLAYLQAKNIITSEMGGKIQKNDLIKIDAADIGGPSAGLMFTLGIISKFNPTDFLGDLKIAGTGTIENGGKVGPIGGITHKMRGSANLGIKYFLAPASNCNEVLGVSGKTDESGNLIGKSTIPEGMQVAKVDTLQSALKAISYFKNGKKLTDNMQCNIADFAE